MNFPTFWLFGVISLSSLPGMGQVQIVEDESTKREPRHKPSRIIESARLVSDRLKTQEKKLPCTTFVQEVLKQLEIELSADEIATLQIRGIGEAKVAAELAAGNPALRGGPGMLIDKGIANVVRPEDARPGDIVQYWYRDSKKASGIGGHTGIVQELLPDGKLAIVDSNIKRGAGRLELNLKATLHPTVARLK